MPDLRELSKPNPNKLNIHTRVITKDGPGKIIGFEKRQNTNGGPGCLQYRIQLDDKRIRHYNINNVTEIT